MPKIPTPDELGLAPSRTPTSALGPTNINVPDLSVGAQQISALGRALTNMYQDAAKAQIVEQGIEDERILMESESRLADLRRDALFGEGGLMTLEKADAIGASDRAAGLMGEWAEQFDRSGLSEAGRDAMDAFLSREEDRLLDTVARHEMNERAAYRNAMLRDAAANAAAEAKYWYADAEMLSAQEAQVRASFDALLDDGATDEDIAANEAAADRAVSRMYADTILHAVGEGGGTFARPLLQGLIERGVFEAGSEQTLDLMRIVAEDEREGVVQHLSERIWVETDGNLDQALQQVDAAELDGETKKDLKADIERRFSQREDIEKRNKTEATHAATHLAYQGQLDQLGPEFRMSVDSDIWQELENINAGMAPSTNPTVYNTLYAMPDQQLADYDVTQHVGDLSATDYRAILSRQQEAVEGRNRTNRSATQGTIKTFFVTNDVTDETQQARLTVMIEEWANTQFQNTNTYPSVSDIRQKLTEYTYSGDRSSFLFGTIGGADSPVELEQGAVSEASPENARIYNEDLTPDQRQAALQALTSAGFKSATIEEIFAAAVLIEADTTVNKDTVKALLER